MIVALEGILENKGMDAVTLKTGPVSINVFTSGTTLGKLGKVGEKVHLNTYLFLRDDIIALYGFGSISELWLFQKFISVSGVGPKIALSLLSYFPADQLVASITGGDTDILTKAPGVGKKIAGRLILELKGKLDVDWGGKVMPSVIQEESDVIAALTGLGYTTKEAMQAISGLRETEGLTIEEKVKLVLQQLAKR